MEKRRPVAAVEEPDPSPRPVPEKVLLYEGAKVAVEPYRHYDVQPVPVYLVQVGDVIKFYQAPHDPLRHDKRVEQPVAA